MLTIPRHRPTVELLMGRDMDSLLFFPVCLFLVIYCGLLWCVTVVTHDILSYHIISYYMYGMVWYHSFISFFYIISYCIVWYCMVWYGIYRYIQFHGWSVQRAKPGPRGLLEGPTSRWHRGWRNSDATKIHQKYQVSYRATRNYVYT